MKKLEGMLQVELTSAECARTLTAINECAIPISSLAAAGELTVSFWVRRRDLQKLKTLCAKRGDGLKILRKRGLYWTGMGLLRRPVLVVGLVFLMALGSFLPTRVLFIRVEGNEAVPSRRILEAAESCGVGFGASRRYVRSEKVKNALLEAIPELQWAGVNTAGCTAVISVRERNVPKKDPGEQPRSIVADRDGFILSADVTRGTAMFRAGQTVKKGQTLISGYTDCGICIRATGAEGEIFAQTRREIEAVTPQQWLERGPEGEVRRKYSLLFRKKRINLWKDSGICDATCGRMYREFYVTLPGGFQLPLALCVETCFCGPLQTVELNQGTAEASLDAFADAYLKQQMISGEIRQKMQTVSLEAGVYRLEGSYDCTEMIGRVLKIGETNGKRD